MGRHACGTPCTRRSGPLGGALIAVATLGDASPALQGLVALLGGTVAASSHLTKAGTRAIANASPEPFSNWILSLVEDVFVLGLGYVTLQYPLVALAIVLALLVHHHGVRGGACSGRHVAASEDARLTAPPPISRLASAPHDEAERPRLDRLSVAADDAVGQRDRTVLNGSSGAANLISSTRRPPS